MTQSNLSPATNGHNDHSLKVTPLPTAHGQSAVPIPLDDSQVYRGRLLRLYAQYIQQTGDIQYPELVQLVETVHLIETNSRQSYLMPRVVHQLENNLQAAQDELTHVSPQLKTLLYQLIAALQLEQDVSSFAATNGLAHSHPENRSQENTVLNHRMAAELTLAIQEQLQTLCQSISYILDLAQQYTAANASDLFDQAEDDETAALLQKSWGDLFYIRTYLSEHLYAEAQRHAFIDPLRLPAHFHRLHQYLDVLPATSKILISLVQQSLQARLPKSPYIEDDDYTA